MATALCDFGCSGTVELSAPDAIRHNRPVHTAKTFEFLSVFFRPQKRKAAFRAEGSVLASGLLRIFVLPIAARADQTGCTFLGQLGIRLRFSCSHKASGSVLGKWYLRSCVHELLSMLIRTCEQSGQNSFLRSAQDGFNDSFINTFPQAII